MDKYDREVLDPSAAEDAPYRTAHLDALAEGNVDLETTRPLRCLVGGSADAALRANTVSFVRNPEQPFDVIILNGRSDIPALRELYATCSNPAAPIVAFDDSIGARADVIARSRTPQAVLEAIAAVTPLALRVAALPRLPLGAERCSLLALTLAHTRNAPIAAAWSPAEPESIAFPLLAGIPMTRALLEDMAETGLLRRRFFDRLFLCERCDSSRIHAREVCVSCRSSHLTEHPIMHHYPCGAQDAQPAFETEDGYRCPKCRKELRHYGVDYDKPGIVIVCAACRTTMAEPDASFVCVDCGHHTPSDRAARRDWFSYDLTQSGIDAVKTAKLPGAQILLGNGHSQSMRDFKLVARHHLSLAMRYGRPLSAWRMILDCDEIAKQAGKPGAEEIRALACEIALADIRAGDASVVLPWGLVVCLPETTGKQAAEMIRAIDKRIRKLVKSPVPPRFEIVDRGEVSRLIDDVS